MENWKTMLEDALKANRESWSDIESNTMSEADMDKQFNSDFGGVGGCAFTVWTTASVYFPVIYDGATWVGRVSRHPDGKPTTAQGGSC